MAVLILADGTTSTVAPARGSYFELDELQRLVGGYIQVLRTNDGRLMVCNEDGKRLGLQPNFRACLLTDGVVAADDAVVGDVVICEPAELD